MILSGSQNNNLLLNNKMFIIYFITSGSVIVLENLRFHIEEEGKGVDADGKKVFPSCYC